MTLSKKQQAFVEEFFNDFNATQAAIRAGYSERSARSIGSENLTKPDISEAINQRLRETAMSADEVLMRLADHGRGDLSDFIKLKNGLPVIDFEAARRAEKLHLIKKLKVKTRTYTMGRGDDAVPVTERDVDFELYDAQSALQLLGRAHNLFRETVEHTGKDGGPIETVNAELTDEERAARLNAILDRARARRGGSPSGERATDLP